MKQDLCALLRQNSYPGRGILLGRDAGGENAVIAYFIMGRSENSRNRVFEETADGIRTRAYDESKMTDPSLIIYRPVRQLERVTIVTNGDQTDTIYSALDAGGTFEDALLTRTFEPDEPNYTPRISGLLIPYDKNGSREVLVQLSILKSLEGPVLLLPPVLQLQRHSGGGGPVHQHLPGGWKPPALLLRGPLPGGDHRRRRRGSGHGSVDQPQRREPGVPLCALHPPGGG